MKKPIYYFFPLIIYLLISCSEKSPEAIALPEEKPMEFLAFKLVDLGDMKAFKTVDRNWQIVGGVYVDRSQKKVIKSTPGTGVLVNQPTRDQHQDNLFTVLEHGDIEIELDVMMPVQSNSGLYFQGRYEVQLLDSWGVREPKHSDMGGDIPKMGP